MSDEAVGAVEASWAAGQVPICRVAKSPLLVAEELMHILMEDDMMVTFLKNR